jgi:hypothetical protein
MPHVATFGDRLARARTAVRAADLPALSTHVISQPSEEAAGSLAVWGGGAGLGAAGRER